MHFSAAVVKATRRWVASCGRRNRPACEFRRVTCSSTHWRGCFSPRSAVVADQCAGGGEGLIAVACPGSARCGSVRASAGPESENVEQISEDRNDGRSDCIDIADSPSALGSVRRRAILGPRMGHSARALRCTTSTAQARAHRPRIDCADIDARAVGSSASGAGAGDLRAGRVVPGSILDRAQWRMRGGDVRLPQCRARLCSLALILGSSSIV